MKKIGIIGSGDVGRALAEGFLQNDYKVIIGTRQPGEKQVRQWLGRDDTALSFASFKDAAGQADIVVFAFLWTARNDVLKDVENKDLAQKTVIDATNPLEFIDGAPRLAIGTTTSAGEEFQKQFPDAKIVKAFNTVGNGVMYAPSFEEKPTMCIAGNSDDAKQAVTKILDDFGWESADLGDIQNSRWLEAMCMAWVAYGMKHNSWHHGWKLLLPKITK